jgi:hypothetical protein
MPHLSLYEYAHLVVSAIRVLEHRLSAPPALEDVSELLGVSIEETNRLCRKFRDLEVIEMMEKSDSTRLFVKDHRKIEQISDQPEESRLEAELRKFKQARQAQGVDLDSVKTEQADKKKKLHQELEQKLKNNLKK